MIRIWQKVKHDKTFNVAYTKNINSHRSWKLINMPIHFRGFCSLDLAKWTFNLSKEPYSYEGLKLAPTLRTIVYLKICKGLVSLDLLHDISRLFTPFGLWADYGAFQGNLNFSQTPYFFSWEIECAPGSTWNLGNDLSTKIPERKKKTAVTRLISNKLF